MAEHVRFICDNCGATGKAPVRMAGHVITCPACKQSVELPGVLPPSPQRQRLESPDDQVDSPQRSGSENAWNLRVACSASILLSSLVCIATVIAAVVVMRDGDPSSIGQGVVLIAGGLGLLLPSLVLAFAGRCLADIHERLGSQDQPDSSF